MFFLLRILSILTHTHKGKGETLVMMIMIILTLLNFNSKPVEATRPLVALMKSKKVETAKVDSVSQDRAPVTPSGPNPCTHLLDPANGSSCHH